MVLGSGMMLWGLCIILSGAKSYAEDNMEEEILLTEQVEWEENLSVSEETEEILIENLAPLEDTLDGVSDFAGAEQSPDGYTDFAGAEQSTDGYTDLAGVEQNTYEAQKSDGELIQEAIDSEAEVTITLSQNISLTETIRVPSGKTVALVPAEGIEITIFRSDGFSGPMFCVEKDGLLILGREGGRLLIHQGEGDAAESLIEEGEGMLSTEGEVLVFPEPKEAFAADSLISDSLEMDSLPEEELIEDGTMPVSMDLNDAVIEWMDPAEQVYNGTAHTPEILVWAGSCLLMKGFDYDVAYYNNVHAGTAELVITATGFGICTGSKTVTFPIIQAVPEYQVENQKAESGVLLSDLKIPESAAGVNGEKVTGTLYWSDSEGGMALPADMTLSGMEGETLTLYWTFYPGETFSDYLPVSGNMTITFLAAKIPDNGMAGEWDGLTDGIGNLSNDSSSFGAMEETEKPIETPTEKTTEKSTETPTEKTTEKSTETPTEKTTEKPTETPTEKTTEKPTETPTEKTTETPTETPDTEKETVAGSGTAVSGGISAGSGVSTGGGSVVRSGSSGTAVSGSGGSSGISVTSGVSGKTSAPKTGDASEPEVWMIWCFLAIGVCGAVLGYQRRKG